MSERATVERSTPMKTHKTSKAPRLTDLSIDEGVAYLISTFGMDEDDAREKVLIAKGVINRDSHAVAK